MRRKVSYTMLYVSVTIRITGTVLVQRPSVYSPAFYLKWCTLVSVKNWYKCHVYVESRFNKFAYITGRRLHMVIHPFVTSRIDYCKTLLFGLPNCELAKLQRVQNAAARLLTSTRKYNHITPVLRELHWLPVR